MELKAYKTLLAQGKDELIVNKSRFICYGAPAETEEQALEFLKQVRANHQDATHNCYAYAIGSNMGIMRYSDDGEPGGTAGMPIMEVIKAKQVTNCIVVITRYFGGILLGAGGLVRAYSQSAVNAIAACGVGVVEPTARYLIEVPYTFLGKVEYMLKSQPVIIEDKTFTDVVTLTLCIRCRDEAQFLSDFTAGTDGKIEPFKAEELYMPWKETQ